MNFKLIEIETPTEAPCLMENDMGQTGLVTYDNDGNNYVTIIKCSEGSAIGQTWKSDLKHWNPLPKGVKVVLEN